MSAIPPAAHARQHHGKKTYTLTTGFPAAQRTFCLSAHSHTQPLHALTCRITYAISFSLFIDSTATAMEIEMLARDEKSRPARCRGAKRSSTIYGGAVPVGQVSLARRIGDPELLYGRSFSDTFQNRIDASRVMPVFSARATKCAANRASPTICRATVSSQSAACKAEAPVKSARGKTSIAIRIRSHQHGAGPM